MDCLSEHSYHLETHTLAVVDPHSRYCVAWVGPFSLQVELKVFLNELWNELHNYAQMYRNVLQTT